MSTESADEFTVIRSLFAPLATAPGARGLTDDVAVTTLPDPVIVTTDAIVEGVHFLADDPIETIAMKALRVNVSDIVAKGAKPVAALLTLAWPQQRPASQIAAFAAALARDLKHFDIALLGGDTTSTPGPLVVSITLFGAPLGARTPARADAQPGQDIWTIGGELGSAWLGLELRSRRIPLAAIQRGRDEGERATDAAMAETMPAYLTLPGAAFDAEAAWLMSVYLAPFVRPECAPIIARFASASMDVSDGLAADAAKLAEASGVRLVIVAEAAPLSIPAQRWVDHGGDMGALLSGGDDYIALFTADRAHRAALEAADSDKSLRLTRIGEVHAGSGVRIIGRDGADISFAHAGHVHRLGR